MPKLPVTSARKAIKALERLGFYVDHQKGSHVVLRHPTKPGIIVVPYHPELDRGTLKSILRQAKISIEEFLEVLLIIE